MPISTLNIGSSIAHNASIVPLRRVKPPEAMVVTALLAKSRTDADMVTRSSVDQWTLEMESTACVKR